MDLVPDPREYYNQLTEERVEEEEVVNFDRLVSYELECDHHNEDYRYW